MRPLCTILFSLFLAGAGVAQDDSQCPPIAGRYQSTQMSTIMTVTRSAGALHLKIGQSAVIQAFLDNELSPSTHYDWIAEAQQRSYCEDRALYIVTTGKRGTENCRINNYFWMASDGITLNEEERWSCDGKPGGLSGNYWRKTRIQKGN